MDLWDHNMSASLINPALTNISILSTLTHTVTPISGIMHFIYK